MLDRNEFGAEKYGRYLTPRVEDNMLQHAYEEALDLAVYLKTRILQEQETYDLAKQLKTAFSKA